MDLDRELTPRDAYLVRQEIHKLVENHGIRPLLIEAANKLRKQSNEIRNHENPNIRDEELADIYKAQAEAVSACVRSLPEDPY